MSVLVPPEAELLTPEIKKMHSSKYTANASVECTPETPKIGTPFHTCSVIQSNAAAAAAATTASGTAAASAMSGVVKKLSDTISKECNHAYPDDEDDDNEDEDHKDVPATYSYSKPVYSATINSGYGHTSTVAAKSVPAAEAVEESVDDVILDEPSIMDPPETMFSPPKTSKLLQPRRGIVNVSSASTTGVSSSKAVIAGGSIAASAAAVGVDVSDRDSWWIPAISSEVQ
jgi:hypothetical protein